MGIAFKVFQTRLEAKVYDRVRALAQFKGQSVNATIRDLLAQGVAEADGKDSREQDKAK
jgi:hypothetical protein